MSKKNRKMEVVDVTPEQEAQLQAEEAAKVTPKVEVDLERTYSLTEAKAILKNGPVAGLKFQVEASDNKAGALPAGTIFMGVVLAERSGRGKVQAELSCSKPGCTETHIREVSDFHQAYLCRTHASAKGKMTPEQKAAKLQAKAAALLAQ